MSQGWICRNCGEANSEGFTVCTRCGEVPDLPERGIVRRLVTKSYALDMTLAALATMLLSVALLVLGTWISSKTDFVVAIFIAYGIAVLASVIASVLLRKTYRGVMLGVIIGACLLLNPVSACFAVIGVASAIGA